MLFPAELIAKNLFTMILSKSAIAEIEKEMMKKTLKEIGVVNDKFNQYYSEWQADKKALKKSEDAAENRQILGFLVVAAYFDQNVGDDDMKTIRQFAALAGADTKRIESFIASHPRLEIQASISETAMSVQTLLNSGTQAKPKAPKLDDGEPLVYVANQISREGIDELQALVICGKLGLNAALSGSPGVGKTQSVIEAARILNMPLYTKTCSSRTTESHIISHPSLVEHNGVTITEHENGPLCLAMEAPGIFYGDEYNLLKEDVQKRLNSAFDDRRYIDRNDGVQIAAKPDFCSFISYNPTQSMSRRDLEDSVADRFLHFHYNEWISDFKAYVSMKISGIRMKKALSPVELFGIQLELRGIDSDGNFFVCESMDRNGKWFDFFTNKETSKRPEYLYHCHKIKHLNRRDSEAQAAMQTLSGKCYKDVELARVFARFTELIDNLATTGKSPMLEKIGLDEISKKDDIQALNVHKSSTRIISAALIHYHYFLGKGWNMYLAQSYATSLIIGQICYGSYRTMKVRDITNIALMNQFANAFSLYATDKPYNTSLVKENIL